MLARRLRRIKRNIDLTYRGTSNQATAGTIYTHTALAIGPAHPNRRVTVALQTSDDAPSLTATGVTIGGVAATRLVQQEGVDNGGVTYGSIWTALVPTGTTADVVVAYSESVFRSYLALYTSTTWGGLYTAASDNSHVSGLLSVSLDAAAGGAIVACSSYALSPNTGATGWTGVDQDYNDMPAANRPFSGGSKRFASAQAAVAIEVQWSTAGNPMDLVAVSMFN